MGSFRQGVAHSDVQTPLLIVGGLLLLVVLLAIFQQQLRRRRQKKYHPPIELQSNGVLGQIQRRKDDLNRFIGKLKSQLEVREQQLRIHDELEDLVTARVHTSRQQDEEWKEIMRAGKKLHGKKWTQPRSEGQPSLKELMEMHKDELLEMKGNVGTSAVSGRRERRQSSSTRRASEVMQLPRNHEPTVGTAPVSPRVVPPQWQSTRRIAGSLNKPPLNPEQALEADSNPWSKNKFQADDAAERVAPVPKLDLTRLSSHQPVENPASPSSYVAAKPKKSFEEAFQRQAKLASSLKQKKKT